MLSSLSSRFACNLSGPRRVRRTGLAAVIAAGVAAAVLAARPVRRVRVEGASMRPALEDGDRLLVVRGLRVRVGDVVAVPDPRRPERLLVKRVVGRDGRWLTVLGDDADASTDSRAFGPVPASSVVGRAVHRYAPEARRGPVRWGRP